MKITTIIGARPQFIKAAVVSRAIADSNKLAASNSSIVTEVIVHTGQHYDHNMSEVFFKELEIPEPHLNLEVGSGYHGQQTGQMLIKLEEVMLSEKPDWVLVYGDTNSTLAGALAAVKLHIPVAHVEAGLRSFNKSMPEEHNRVLTDHCSDLLFCPTSAAVKNLKIEGVTNGVHRVGDVMFDSVLFNTELATKRSKILETLKLQNKAYALATVHRAENTDDSHRLQAIFEALEKISSEGLRVVLPLHPRTRKLYDALRFSGAKIKIIEPVSYLDMLQLEQQARLILTDSGGVQKEAYWMKVPCITLRDETEWIETVEAGWNILAGADRDKIVESAKTSRKPSKQHPTYGDGKAGEKIVDILRQPGCYREDQKCST
jgi:UDP-GlcNAc3NAcA epimerase